MASTITSPVQFCNLALSQSGSRAQVQSISPSDGTAAGDACTLLYQPTVDAFARGAHWNCLRFQASLTLLKAAAGTPENLDGAGPQPPQPWLYEYALPNDCLKARFVVPILQQRQPNPPLTTGPSVVIAATIARYAVPFLVAVDTDTQTPPNEAQVILTNLRGAQLVYTKRLANIALWDSQFVMGAKAALAAWLVPALSLNAQLMALSIQIAKGTLDSARITDGNEGPISQDHTPDWILIRGGGSPNPAGLFIAPWDSFEFPGGIDY